MAIRTADDSARGVRLPRPRLRGVFHQVWFELSLVAGTALVLTTHGGRARWAVVVYAASVSGLFGASALYHRVPWRPVVMRQLQRLDAAMIFVLIAGTYTPVLVLAAPRPFGVVLLTVVWALAGLGIVARLIWMDAPQWLVGSAYFGLGWLAVAALPAAWPVIGVGGVGLITAGGLLYTVGALGFHRQRPDPVPAVFGYHEVFHTYVCAAATCHYVAIALFVVR